MKESTKAVSITEYLSVWNASLERINDDKHKTKFAFQYVSLNLVVQHLGLIKRSG